MAEPRGESLAMTADAAVLVVGADGTIGAAVAARLEAAGQTVIRTSRRGTPGTIPLDLASDPASWRLPDGVAAAVLCAAVTSTEVCRSRPDEARRVNVDAPVELGRRIAGAGGRCVFLSTNMVFDGTVPFTPGSASRCPQTAYGRMKAEAEERLLALGGAATVVRLTKVVGRTLPVIEAWRAALERGETVRPFADLPMAPVTLDLAAAVIAAAAREPLGPILQVSARADLAYAEVAARLAARWGFAPGLVRPVTVAESGVVLEHVPAHTTLDASSVRDRLSLEPPDPWAAIDEVA
jgi:dTDP-4-dehydrorhamnose reductase